MNKAAGCIAAEIAYSPNDNENYYDGVKKIAHDGGLIFFGIKED